MFFLGCLRSGLFDFLFFTGLIALGPSNWHEMIFWVLIRFSQTCLKVFAGIFLGVCVSDIGILLVGLNALDFSRRMPRYNWKCEVRRVPEKHKMF